MDKSKTLYWVKFIDQESGMSIDTYFLAKSISVIDDNIADILEIRVINDVSEL